MFANYDTQSEFGAEFASSLRDFLANRADTIESPTGQYCGNYSCVAVSGGSTALVDMVDKIESIEGVTLFYGVLIFGVFACIAYHLSLLALLRSALSTSCVYMVAQCIW